MTILLQRGKLVVLLVFLGFLVCLPVASAATPVATTSTPQLEPVLPIYQSEFDQQLGRFPAYDFDLVLDDAQSTIGGSLIVTFPNETGSTQDSIPFRLYPNASYYGEGGTTIESLAVDGRTVEPRFDASNTVLFVDLPEPLAPGDSVSIAMDFRVAVPWNSDGSFGIFNHDVAAKRFVLADWYPVVAGWDETGWRLEPPTDQGDPTFATTSAFQVALQAPAGYDVIATGDETILDDGTVRIETGPVREFAMVVAQELETLSAMAGDTTITAHVAPDHLENGQHMLDVAVAALDFYDQAFDTYPYRTLDIVETDLSLAYGVSWSGMLFINQTQLGLGADNLATLDFTIFHEVGHQWWGGTVGANSNDHTFMVEGLTNATALLAQAAVQGPEAAANSLYAWMVTPYWNLVSGPGDAVADVSIFVRFRTAPLSTRVYGKGGLGFLAIRNAIGNEAFISGLAAYAKQFRLGIADPEDLQTAFETASGQSLQELWSFWFNSAQTTPDDINTLVPEIIASL
jgi:hypothetical protein